MGDLALQEHPLEYHQLHRARNYRVWKPLVGMLLVALLGFGVVPIAWMFVFMVVAVLMGRQPDELVDGIVGGEVTPWALAYLMVTLISLIPAVWVVSRPLHGLRLGWVTSVFGRMRWTYTLVCVGLSVVALGATLAVGALTPQEAMPTDDLGLNDFTRTTAAYLLIVVFLVPFQAAGEEYFFRGYLTQACGGLFTRRWVARSVAVLVPAFLFALAHGAQDPPIFFDRLAFGVVAGVLVLVTGGLEAAIAMHVLNNLLAFGMAIAFTDMTSALNPTAGTWWTLPSTLTQSLVYLALAWWAARRMGLANAVWGAVLSPPQVPVYGSSGRAPSA
ncbi:CPBP family intramembrane glutamic endopeptidase [Nocardioides malaquae]|nr:CPBP family intramembrane glutamic endopeptidase [Nocardioides malaquae]